MDHVSIHLHKFMNTVIKYVKRQISGCINSDTQKKEINIKRITKFFLLLCLLTGIGIKLEFMFQNSLWPDEALYLYIARNLAVDLTNLTDLNGNYFFHNPPLLMYILSIFSKIGFVTFDQVSRFVIILLSTGTIAITYVIGKKLYHPVVGLIAASLVAVCPLTNWIGVRILTDVPVTFFIFLSICMLVYKKKAAFYVFALCAILTKYVAFPVIFIPLFMRLKSKNWFILYTGLFIALLTFTSTKSLYQQPNGWISYFYNFFSFPDMLQMFNESEFFLGYIILTFSAIGFLLSIKNKQYNALFHWVVLFGIFRFFLPWLIFRVSRYTIPLYPGLYLLAAYGCYQTTKHIYSSWPKYCKLTITLLIITMSSILYLHFVKSMTMLKQTSNSFVGFDKSCEFLKKQPEPHSVATASPRQIKYFVPTFEVYNIEGKIRPESFHVFLDKNNIHYLSIDRWSPHLPLWLKSYDYQNDEYTLLYKRQNVLLFKVSRKN